MVGMVRTDDDLYIKRYKKYKTLNDIIKANFSTVRSKLLHDWLLQGLGFIGMADDNILTCYNLCQRYRLQILLCLLQHDVEQRGCYIFHSNCFNYLSQVGIKCVKNLIIKAPRFAKSIIMVQRHSHFSEDMWPQMCGIYLYYGEQIIDIRRFIFSQEGVLYNLRLEFIDDEDMKIIQSSYPEINWHVNHDNKSISSPVRINQNQQEQLLNHAIYKGVRFKNIEFGRITLDDIYTMIIYGNNNPPTL
jgi:hypothetical protein